MPSKKKAKQATGGDNSHPSAKAVKGKKSSSGSSFRSNPQFVNTGTDLKIPREPITLKSKWITWGIGQTVSGYTTTGYGLSGSLYFLHNAGSDSKRGCDGVAVPIFPGASSNNTAGATAAVTGSHAVGNLLANFSSIAYHRLILHLAAKQPTTIGGDLVVAPYFGPASYTVSEAKAGNNFSSEATDSNQVTTMHGAVRRKVYESFSVDLSESIFLRNQKRSVAATSYATTGYSGVSLMETAAGFFCLTGACPASSQNEVFHDVFVSCLLTLEDWIGDQPTIGANLGRSRPVSVPATVTSSIDVKSALPPLGDVALPTSQSESKAATPSTALAATPPLPLTVFPPGKPSVASSAKWVMVSG